MDWQLLRDTLTLNAHIEGFVPCVENRAAQIAKAKLDGGATTMAAGILELIELGETNYVIAVLERTVTMMADALAQLAGTANTKGQLLLHSDGFWPLDGPSADQSDRRETETVMRRQKDLDTRPPEPARAAVGQMILERYVEVTGQTLKMNDPDELECMLDGLLAELRHWAAAAGVDFESSVAETTGPYW
ncbi:MAG: hypothetical protein WD156_08895 [Acidimicrobiia bacterium]